MDQFDFIGGGPARPPKPFKDIPNTRPSVAEEKARLALELGRLCLKCPPKIASGSIQITRQWLASQKQNLKLAGNTRATVPDLERAVRTMRGYL